MWRLRSVSADLRVASDQNATRRRGSSSGVHVDRIIVGKRHDSRRNDRADFSRIFASDQCLSMRVTNSTISGNTAVDEGGGIAAGAFGEKRIVSSTITGNDADRGGGIQGPFVATNLPVELKGTIVAGDARSAPTRRTGPIACS